MPAPSTRLVFAIAAALYLSLCAATGMWWEWEHDEGVSFSQAFGTPLVGWRDEGSRIAVAYLRVDGATPRTASGVMDALTVGGGMHPPAYYLFLRQWGGWFGTNRLLLRLPIYLLGAVSLLAVGALARRLVGGKAEPWAMLLLAASPWFVGFSNLARPYALALCLALLSSNALLLALETRRLVWRLAFAFVSAFGLYTIYPYVYVLGWQLATWFVFAAGWGGETSPGQLEPAPGERRASRELAALAGIVLLIALLYAPWLPRLLGHLDVTAGQDWYFSRSLPLADIPDRSWRLIRSFALGEAVRAIGATELRSVCAALIALACLVGVLSRRRTGRPSPLLSPGARAAWIAMPLVPAAMLLADQLRDTHTFFLSRQSFALLPLLLLLLLRVHLGGGDAWLRRFSTGCLVAWLALLSAASLANIVTRAQTDTALESVAKIVARSDEPATLLVLSGAAPGYVIPLLLTLRDEGVSQLRVRYAHGDGLYRLVEDRIRREGGGALRLVNFAGRYGAEGRWSEALLADVERRAVAVGWEVRTASPGSSLGTRGESAPGWMLESLGTPGPQLVILTPVGVKSFDP